MKRFLILSQASIECWLFCMTHFAQECIYTDGQGRIVLLEAKYGWGNTRVFYEE